MATLRVAKIQPAALTLASSGDGGAVSPPCWRGGEIKRLVLSSEGRTIVNQPPVATFNDNTRMLKNHVGYSFCSALTELYRQRIRPGSDVLDLMAACSSYLPPEAKYKRVVGHSLVNATDLLHNDRLDSFFVKDLNDDPSLPETMTESFDAVVCAASVQRLQQPERVFSEIWRVLRPGGVCIVSFSNNNSTCDDAIAAWRHGTSRSRSRLVTEYFQSVAGYRQPHVIRSSASSAVVPGASHVNPVEFFLPLLQPPEHEPLYAVLAYKGFKSLYN